jgi:hypothetical protein
MSSPKIHHFVPQSLLRNFSISGEDKKIWVYDKLRSRAWPEAIKTAGGEKYFNTVIKDGDRLDFEFAFDELDRELPNLIHQIIATEDVSALDPEQRYKLAFLAVIQLLRVKIVRHTHIEFRTQLKKALADLGLKDQADSVECATDNDGRVASLSLLADSRRMASWLAEKELTLYKATSGLFFWTSDNPIQMANHFPGGSLGLMARGVDVYWPISSQLILSFRCPSVTAKLAFENPNLARFLSAEPRLSCRPIDVRWFNQLQARRSTRFLYSCKNDYQAALEDIQDPKDYKNPVLIQVGKVGTWPKRQGMPDQISLHVSGLKTEHLLEVVNWKRDSGGYLVTLSPQAKDMLIHLLEDSPFQQAEIHNPCGEGWGMRDVLIEVIASEPLTIRIEHSDPALRLLASEIHSD